MSFNNKFKAENIKIFLNKRAINKMLTSFELPASPWTTRLSHEVSALSWNACGLSTTSKRPLTGL
jgi:hypothetical protein